MEIYNESADISALVRWVWEPNVLEWTTRALGNKPLAFTFAEADRLRALNTNNTWFDPTQIGHRACLYFDYTASCLHLLRLFKQLHDNINSASPNYKILDEHLLGTDGIRWSDGKDLSVPANVPTSPPLNPPGAVDLCALEMERMKCEPLAIIRCLEYGLSRCAALNTRMQTLANGGESQFAISRGYWTNAFVPGLPVTHSLEVCAQTPLAYAQPIQADMAVGPKVHNGFGGPIAMFLNRVTEKGEPALDLSIPLVEGEAVEDAPKKAAAKKTTVAAAAAKKAAVAVPAATKATVKLARKLPILARKLVPPTGTPPPASPPARPVAPTAGTKSAAATKKVQRATVKLTAARKTAENAADQAKKKEDEAKAAAAEAQRKLVEAKAAEALREQTAKKEKETTEGIMAAEQQAAKAAAAAATAAAAAAATALQIAAAAETARKEAEDQEEEAKRQAHLLQRQLADDIERQEQAAYLVRQQNQMVNGEIEAGPRLQTSVDDYKVVEEVKGKLVKGKTYTPLEIAGLMAGNTHAEEILRIIEQHNTDQANLAQEKEDLEAKLVVSAIGAGNYTIALESAHGDPGKQSAIWELAAAHATKEEKTRVIDEIQRGTLTAQREEEIRRNYATDSRALLNPLHDEDIASALAVYQQKLKIRRDASTVMKEVAELVRPGSRRNERLHTKRSQSVIGRGASSIVNAVSATAANVKGKAKGALKVAASAIGGAAQVAASAARNVSKVIDTIVVLGGGESDEVVVVEDDVAPDETILVDPVAQAKALEEIKAAEEEKAKAQAARARFRQAFETAKDNPKVDVAKEFQTLGKYAEDVDKDDFYADQMERVDILRRALDLTNAYKLYRSTPDVYKDRYRTVVSSRSLQSAEEKLAQANESIAQLAVAQDALELDARIAAIEKLMTHYNGTVPDEVRSRMKAARSEWNAKQERKQQDDERERLEDETVQNKLAAKDITRMANSLAKGDGSTRELKTQLDALKKQQRALRYLDDSDVRSVVVSLIAAETAIVNKQHKEVVAKVGADAKALTTITDPIEYKRKSQDIESKIRKLGTQSLTPEADEQLRQVRQQINDDAAHAETMAAFESLNAAMWSPGERPPNFSALVQQIADVAQKAYANNDHRFSDALQASIQEMQQDLRRANPAIQALARKITEGWNSGFKPIRSEPETPQMQEGKSPMLTSYLGMDARQKNQLYETVQEKGPEAQQLLRQLQYARGRWEDAARRARRPEQEQRKHTVNQIADIDAAHTEMEKLASQLEIALHGTTAPAGDEAEAVTAKAGAEGDAADDAAGDAAQSADTPFKLADVIDDIAQDERGPLLQLARNNPTLRKEMEDALKYHDLAAEHRTNQNYDYYKSLRDAAVQRADAILQNVETEPAAVPETPPETEPVAVSDTPLRDGIESMTAEQQGKWLEYAKTNNMDLYKALASAFSSQNNMSTPAGRKQYIQLRDKYIENADRIYQTMRFGANVVVRKKQPLVEHVDRAQLLLALATLPATNPLHWCGNLSWAFIQSGLAYKCRGRYMILCKLWSERRNKQIAS